ncbi:MAG: transglutaminase-like domain-containing protein [Armatimonadota bacterium]|nr:transglutaminase-like domain-containing protein [bacterium]
MRLLDSKHGTGNSLVLMLLVVISGGIYFGYRNPLSLSVPSTPVVRGLVIAIGAIVFWAASSWICGSYRCKKLGDFRGMKSAILSIGRSLMHFFLALSITCIVLTLVTANVSDAYVKSVASNILVLLVILITVYAILDIICVINGLLVTSSRYRPLLDINEDTLGPIEPPDEHSLGTITRLDRASHQIGMIEPPPAKTSASSLVQLLTLQSTRSDQAILKCSPDMSIALRIQGIVFLALSVIAQGFAVCVIGKAALVRFMSTNIHDLDFLSGLGSALIYTLLMAAALCGTLRIFRQKTHISVICSSVGFSLLPLSLAVFILSLLPLQVRDGAYGLLFTCALMWGLGYLVMDIGSSLIQRSRLFLALPAIVLVIVTTHFASGYLIKNAHLAVMRSMTIPLRSVENTIVDEFPPSMGGEVRSLIGSMVNVDRADVSAADFVDQVLYSKKVSTRFYEEGQYPSNLSPFRIRAEITANAGWMRRLFPEMSRLTRSAKTPDDVVRIVSKWLKAKMVEITPMTWPPGEKFDQDPITTLICKRGNQMDAAILMIAALRASGVAARTKLFFPDELVTNSYTLAEYFDGVEWKPCYPKIGWVSKPAVRRDDLAKFKQWAYSVPKGSGPSLNILIDGVWYPYCNGRTQPITFTFDPAPGTYMGSYTTGNVCHIRRFVLRPSGK